MANREGRSMTASRKEEELADMERKSKIIVQWMEEKLQAPMPNTNLRETLTDGVVLCKLANVLRPGCIRKFHRQPRMLMMKMENIAFFLTACKTRFSVPQATLFAPTDIHDDSDPASMLKVLRVLLMLRHEFPGSNTEDCEINLDEDEGATAAADIPEPTPEDAAAEPAPAPEPEPTPEPEPASNAEAEAAAAAAAAAATAAAAAAALQAEAARLLAEAEKAKAAAAAANAAKAASEKAAAEKAAIEKAAAEKAVAEKAAAEKAAADKAATEKAAAEKAAAEKAAAEKIASQKAAEVAAEKAAAAKAPSATATSGSASTDSASYLAGSAVGYNIQPEVLKEITGAIHSELSLESKAALLKSLQAHVRAVDTKLMWATDDELRTLAHETGLGNNINDVPAGKPRQWYVEWITKHGRIESS